MSNGEIRETINSIMSIQNGSISNVEEDDNNEVTVKKILFIGGPNSGKSSIIMRYFDGCKGILEKDLPPTMSVEVNIFEGMDKTQYAVFEVPGTQITRYLYTNEAAPVFEEADGIVLVLNAEDRKIKTIEKKLIRLYYLKNFYCPKASITVFFHKAENILQKTKRLGELEKLITKFKKRFSARFFITSLDSECYKRFHYSMQLALLEMPKSIDGPQRALNSSDVLIDYIVSPKAKDVDVFHEMKRKSIRIYENYA